MLFVFVTASYFWQVIFKNLIPFPGDILVGAYLLPVSPLKPTPRLPIFILNFIFGKVSLLKAGNIFNFRFGILIPIPATHS